MKDVWSPAISTPLMELERESVGVLDTVSIVDEMYNLRSWEEKETRKPCKIAFWRDNKFQ